MYIVLVLGVTSYRKLPLFIPYRLVRRSPAPREPRSHPEQHRTGRQIQQLPLLSLRLEAARRLVRVVGRRHSVCHFRCFKHSIPVSFTVREIEINDLRLLVTVQTLNLMKGETTVERYGKKPKRARSPLLETPRKKLSIEYSLMLEEGYRENRSCLGNCLSMICDVHVKS